MDDKEGSPLIAVDWGSVEETFVVWRIEGTLSLQDLEYAYQFSKTIVSLKAYRVDVIVDLRTANIPNQIIHRAIAYHYQHIPINLGKTIILYPSDYWQRLFVVFENFFPNLSHDMIFTASVDEAYALVLPAA